MLLATKNYRWRVTIAFLLTAVLGVGTPVATFAQEQPPAKEQKKKEEKPKPPQEDPEVRMGREAHADLLKSGIKLINDPNIVGRVKTIGDKIAAVVNQDQVPLQPLYGSANRTPFAYQFFVIDDPDINAFSIPGGYIYLNKGLIDFCQSDDELAGVIGHEIIHAAHHHVVQLQKEQNKYSNALLAGALISLLARVPTTDMMNAMQGLQFFAIQKVNGYGQTAERDSDRNGLLIAHKAGYNPVGMLTFMERLAREQQLRPEVELGIFRTHPPEKERVVAITKHLKELAIPINRRAVTNILKVEVRTVSMPNGSQASEVLLDKKILYRTATPERAKEAADRLNVALNNDAQIYDVTRRGATVLVRGQEIFTITEQDAALPGSPQLEVLVDTGYKNLRFAIYKQSIENGY
jgi:predicted Zn-dependent protease